MKKDEKIFFGLSEGKSRVKIELIEALNQNSNFDWDKNYIRALVNFNNETFQEQFETQFMTVDFEKFKGDLKRIYQNFNGIARFECLDNYLEIVINGEGGVHFSIECLKNETHELTFELPFSRIQILSLIKQLEKITDAFPIIGNEFRITNNSLNHNNDGSAQTNGFSIDHHQHGLAMVNN